MDNQTIINERATIIAKYKAERKKLVDAYTDLIASITRVEELIEVNKHVINDLLIAQFYEYKKTAKKVSMKILKNIDKLVNRIKFSNFKYKLFGINFKQMHRDNYKFITQVEMGHNNITGDMKSYFDNLYKYLDEELLQIQPRSVSPISTQSLSSSRSSSPITSHSASSYDNANDSDLQSGGTKSRKSRRRRFKQATHANRRHAKLSKKYKKQYTKRVH
jgi:hypothetical protein